MSDFLATLEKALFEAPLAPAQLAALEAHWRLVLAWNKRVNLTAIEADADAAWMHYVDSLAGRSQLVPGEVCDLGSGAGYPGVPLAIACPERDVTLVEPRQKRASFLDVCSTRLQLSNVRVIVGRSDETPPARFANVVTRATFSSNDELAACLNWVAPGGRLIAYRADEVSSDATRIVPYALRSETHALHIWEKSAT